MRILITGVAGFIGSNFAKHILDAHGNEYEVIGIDNLSGGYVENVPDGVEFHVLDLVKDDLSPVFKGRKIDYVFHLASYAAEGISPWMRSFVYSNNILSTSNIVNACINHDAGKLVFTSSMSVYGDSGEVFNENDRPNPQDPYAVSKYASELDIRTAGIHHGLDWCIVRPHNVYGEGQCLWDRYRNVFGIWMRKTLQDEPLLIYGDGNQVRCFSYIGDIVEPLLVAGTSDRTTGEVINLGGTTPHSLNESAEIFQGVTGCRDFTHVEARNEISTGIPSFYKSIQFLGYGNETPLETGLRNMWEWAKTQPDREELKFKDTEITKGLHDYWK